VVREVATLTEVPFDEVFGWRFDDADRWRLVDIGRRLDELRRTGDAQRWVYEDGPLQVHVREARRQALGTVLGRCYSQSDWLELALDVWYDVRCAVLVTATVEVACYCPTDHNVHNAAEEEWTATSPAGLIWAATEAVSVLTVWATDESGPSEWRRRSGVPDR
jgi:hypothetical protein